MMDAKRTVSAMVSIWQGKGFPENFPAADACALMMKGWLRINTADKISLTTEGLAALNLAEQMYERGRQDEASAQASTGV